ncbi:MAG: 2Fe-2S iron-sulfur cluster binding domain-containing protein [Candidatus Kapabacteria bacterium]|nr:2Fe-2S iron-sulfur cluster binding domain-containing protein [Ignavibacteriota bacterium]MCW5885125.1 2Fe-2S iron-sulfur cluster binding domain-containing protein [Candidatus Kapabacteria bacterium]
MALKFYSLKVSDLVRETIDTLTITFDVPSEIKSEFAYKHGQYITVKVPVNGSENRRAYSICTSPVTDNKLSITVKKVDDGIVSRYINETLKIGDMLEIMPPLGNFTIDLNPESSNSYFLIGAGSGITPLMSILKTILAVESNSKVYLLYQNRTEESIIFAGQLSELSQKYSGRFYLTNILSQPTADWSGEKGRLNSDFIEKYISENAGNEIFKAHYFICGPQGLMETSDLALRNLKVASYQIHKEIFTITQTSPDEGNENIVLDSNDEIITRKVKIILYSEEIEFLVEPDETVLTAAQREGQDPPFSCQIGACSTCRAKLISGKVYMDERDSLTDEEIEEGYVLTCQAHPLTDDVVIDYDD